VIPASRRRAAALICAIAASSLSEEGVAAVLLSEAAEDGLGLRRFGPACHLAAQAVTACGVTPWPARCAEAESMLRTGWEP